MMNIKSKKLIVLFGIFSIILFATINIFSYSIADAECCNTNCFNDDYAAVDNDNGEDHKIFGNLHIHKGLFSENIDFCFDDPSVESYCNLGITKINDDNIDITPRPFVQDFLYISLFNDCVILLKPVSLCYTAVPFFNIVNILRNKNEKLSYLLEDGSIATSEYLVKQMQNGYDVDLYVCGQPNYKVDHVEVDHFKSGDGDLQIDKLSKIYAGDEVCIQFMPSQEGNFAEIEAVDENGKNLVIAYNGLNQYKFIMPESNVIVKAKTHHIKEYHKKLSQTFHNVGLRAYYVTDEGLYFRAQDEYSDAVCKDNSVWTLIGDSDDFNNWENTYCDEHTTSDGTHYEKGWGGKIPQDM